MSNSSNNHDQPIVRLTPRVVHILIIAAVTLFCILAVALALNLMRLSRLNAHERALADQIAALDEQIASNAQIIDYRRTDEFIENYARQYLNMIKNGEQAFRVTD